MCRNEEKNAKNYPWMMLPQHIGNVITNSLKSTFRVWCLIMRNSTEGKLHCAVKSKNQLGIHGKLNKNFFMGKKSKIAEDCVVLNKKKIAQIASQRGVL